MYLFYECIMFVSDQIVVQLMLLNYVLYLNIVAPSADNAAKVTQERHNCANVNKTTQVRCQNI